MRLAMLVLTLTLIVAGYVVYRVNEGFLHTRRMGELVEHGQLTGDQRG